MILAKHRGKTFEEWEEYIKKDNNIGIRTKKYILVLKEEINRLQNLLNETQCHKEINT